MSKGEKPKTIADVEDEIFDEGYRQGWNAAIKEAIKMLDEIEQKIKEL